MGMEDDFLLEDEDDQKTIEFINSRRMIYIISLM